MKPRARRVTLAAAVLGAGVLAVLVVIHWNTCRDHVEAWWFQLTHETETIEPDDRPGGDVLQVMARVGGRPLIFSPEEFVLSPEGLRKVREPARIRVIEQRFPRRAHVIIRDESTTLPSRTAAR